MMTDRMSSDPPSVDVFEEAAREVADVAEDSFPVRSRGRPKISEDEARLREERRHRFGDRLKKMRLSRGLTLSAAAARAGVSSPRKLAQYESVCYPPGKVIRAIAPVYGITESFLADLMLMHSDPDLYQALRSKSDRKETDGQLLPLERGSLCRKEES